MEVSIILTLSNCEELTVVDIFKFETYSSFLPEKDTLRTADIIQFAISGFKYRFKQSIMKEFTDRQYLK